jgi:hypothetical protein
MTRLLPTLALGGIVAVANPPADIVSAAHRLAPAGSRIVVARELDATFGVVAYEHAGKTTALALRWQDRRWRLARGGPIHFRLVEPRPGATIGRAPVLVHVLVYAPEASNPVGLWIDGRAAYDFTATGADLYYVIRRPRAGRHSVVFFEAVAPHAAAIAWTFTVR